MSNNSITCPIISIIVCTYNRAVLLSHCLQSLVEQTLDSRKYEVIIVNNNSTDETQKNTELLVEKYDNFRVVVEMKQGLSNARNCGWREAHGIYIAFIDDDAKATHDWCERILSVFNSVTPTPAAVGGQIYPSYETKPPSWFTDDFEIRTWGATARFLELPWAKCGFSGSNMAFRKDILEEFGGFSEEFGMIGQTTRMGEDSELFFRVYDRHPWFWYDPSILVYHWTPVRVMKLSSRFCRAFKTGVAVACIQNNRFSLRAFTVGYIGIAFLLLKVPFYLIFENGNFKSKLVKKAEELGSSLGYLFGTDIN